MSNANVAHKIHTELDNVGEKNLTIFDSS